VGVFWQNRPAVARLLGAPELSASVPTPPLVAWLNAAPVLQWGPFGVALFFLITGYVNPFAYARTKAPAYLVGRIFRIYPTYMAGFAISLLALWACRQYFGNTHWPYTPDHVAAHFFPGIRDTLQYPTIDGIIWTLEIEVRFYIVAAVLAALLRSGDSRVFIAPFVLGAVALGLGFDTPWYQYTSTMFNFAMLYRNSADFIVFMFIGTAFHYHHRGRLGAETLLVLVPSLFGLFLTVQFFAPVINGLPYMWSYGLALIVFSFAATRLRDWRGNRVTRFFASISYPLYVVHGLLGYTVMRIVMDRSQQPLLAVSLALVCAIVAAWLLHVVVEQPTHRLGKRLAARLPRGARPERLAA
jgi:peptidoglycan/LPS O-acetylase OafA/YrhL